MDQVETLPETLEAAATTLGKHTDVATTAKLISTARLIRVRSDTDLDINSSLGLRQYKNNFVIVAVLNNRLLIQPHCQYIPKIEKKS